MKWIKNVGIGLVLICMTDSCNKENSFDIVPAIKLKSITFKKGHLTPSPVADTLIFVLSFTDGDGDLGAGAADSSTIDYYNPWYYAYNTSDYSLSPPLPYNTIPLPANYAWLDYKARKLPQFSSLPDINCENWQLLYDNNDPPVVIDTIYMAQNLNAFNINVDVYTKNGDHYDPYHQSNYQEMGCNPNLFRAIFPDLSNDRKKTPLEGTITFRIQSLYLYSSLKNYTLKMGISINDRAFHRSDTVKMEGFTLQQITK